MAEWLTEADTLTRAGNLAPPTLEDLCKWIVTAWEAIPTKVITDSFPICGLNLPPDGSADGNVKCFRAGDKCAAGQDELLQKLKDVCLSSNAPLALPNMEEEADSDAELIIKEESDDETAD